jgi:hypothetical protein
MSVRGSLPRPVKRAGRKVSRGLGTVTASPRMLPGFILAGAQRAGTTSLYRALMTHPLVLPPNYHKGVNYFDVNYDRGPAWYRGHFPVERLARFRTREVPGEPVTFDASGYYMFHPLAPERIAADLPAVKIVTMLRDPIDRAHSAHKHELARGFETEEFERALELEDERLAGEEERIRAEPGYYSHRHRHQAYRRRGHYAEQLQRFLARLPRAQVHVVESERFFETPEEEYSALLEFLELPVVFPPRFDRYNGRPRAPMAQTTRRRLEDYFEPHDAALRELIGRDPVWRT